MVKTCLCGHRTYGNIGKDVPGLRYNRELLVKTACDEIGPGMFGTDVPGLR